MRTLSRKAHARVISRYVFTVTGQGIVHKRPVKAGPLYDGLRSVEGLQADEWVVIDHLNRIREGAKVLAERVPRPAGPSRRVQDQR